ncbi:MAG: sugar phosphate isomerase/epimerase [Mariniphaga sp.]|nr:sugar phosphate isomerase/epimerase [Mariniphaga sp.]
MHLGISSYTYTWSIGVPGSLPDKQMSASDLVDRAASFGLKLVQIADNLPLENFTDAELENLRQYAFNKGISIEMGGRCLTTEHTLKCLKAAEKLHSPILRMVIDGAGFEPDIPLIIQIIRELLPEFESRKIRLAIENHDRLKALEFEQIIKSINSDWVGICLDSANSMGAGEGFETVAEILIPYTINLHLKDFTIQRVSHKMGFIIEGNPAGSGMLNIEDLISKLNRLGRCQSAILELWTPPEADLASTIFKEATWADRSVEFLKQYFK